MTSRPASRGPGGKSGRGGAGVGGRVLYLVAMVTTAVVRQGGTDWPGAHLTGFILTAWFPLLLRRRFPVPVLAVVTVVECFQIAFAVDIGSSPGVNEAMGAYQPAPLAIMAAAFTLAAKQPGRRGWAPGLVAGLAVFLTGLASHGQTLISTSTVACEVVVMATGAGVLVSVRRERIAREAQARLAEIRGVVLDERIRIAQDLHDVLAHHLTLVNAQAAVADYLLRTDPEAASGALQDIAGNTRRALDELRATVGLLRSDDPGDPVSPEDSLGPSPGLSQLDDLLDGFRSVGASITLSTTGPATALSPRGDLAAYRIVQEAVTNATKHAPGAPVAIGLVWSPERLDLNITNARPPGHPAGHQGPGTGHGLIGMRERAATVGGTLATGPTPTGGFAVKATIPVPTPTTLESNR